MSIDPKSKVYIQSFKVKFHEIDVAGVMFFANIFPHIHDVYEDFMHELGWSLKDLSGCGYLLPIVHAEVDYKLPFEYQMTVDLILSVTKIKSVNFTTTYKCIGPHSQIHAQAQLIHCCISAESGKSCSLPIGLRSSLSEYVVADG